jgi:sugar phosphate isomerase/epimerase
MNDPAGTRQLLAEAGLSAPTAHSPDSGWNNGDPDDAVRRASVDAASSVFDAAAEAGVGIVVVHPNAPGDRPFVASEFGPNFARSRASLAVLAERAARAGVKLAVENLPMRGTPRPGGRIEDTLRMIDGLGDHVGVCFDVGHSNANVDDPVTEIRTVGERIFCVHIQDNDGLGQDQHLVPGEGTVDWPRVIDALAECAPGGCPNFEIGLSDSRTGADRNVDELLATLATLRTRWTGK